MRYLILAAGMGRRLSQGKDGVPKALLEVGRGQTVLSRLLGQIRREDPGAGVTVVAGYRWRRVAEVADGCEIVVNPLFDASGINASLWFGRGAFAGAVTVIHGDVVWSEALARRILDPRVPRYVGYDSRVVDPKEINVLARDGDVCRFGVNFNDYSGAYAGLFRLCDETAPIFGEALCERVERGANDPGTYYFAFMRRVLAGELPLAALDFAPDRWQEIDHPPELARARALVADDG